MRHYLEVGLQRTGEYRFPISFAIERLIEDDVLFDRSVHDPRLLRSVCDGSCSLNFAIYCVHLLEDGREQRTLAAPDTTAYPNEFALKEIT